MKKILEQHNIKYNRVLGCDPSTKHIAVCLIVGGEPVAMTKLDLGAGEMPQRLLRARRLFPGILRGLKPDFVAIEQSVFVQNNETVRKMSYIVGTLMAEVLIRDIGMIDVPPMQWKSFLGAKAVTASRKNDIFERLGETEGRKYIQTLKKTMVQDILRERYPIFDWSDDDIADAAGIGLFAWSRYGDID